MYFGNLSREKKHLKLADYNQSILLYSYLMFDLPLSKLPLFFLTSASVLSLELVASCCLDLAVPENCFPLELECFSVSIVTGSWPELSSLPLPLSCITESRKLNSFFTPSFLL